MEIYFCVKSMLVVSLYNIKGECGFMQKGNYTIKLGKINVDSVTFLYFCSDTEYQS